MAKGPHQDAEVREGLSMLPAEFFPDLTRRTEWAWITFSTMSRLGLGLSGSIGSISGLPLASAKRAAGQEFIQIN